MLEMSRVKPAKMLMIRLLPRTSVRITSEGDMVVVLARLSLLLESGCCCCAWAGNGESWALVVVAKRATRDV